MATRSRTAEKTLDIKQSEYPGGLQIWGSNPAFLWTSEKHEEEGIHIHAFKKEGQIEPDEDDTFREFTIDGIKLDPLMVRVLMAQARHAIAEGPGPVDGLPELRPSGVRHRRGGLCARGDAHLLGLRLPSSRRRAGRGMWSPIRSRPSWLSLQEPAPAIAATPADLLPETL